MSMGNFIPLAAVRLFVMAATNPSARTSDDDADVPESGVGMAHLTVVPENFDPAESDEDE